MAFIDHVLYETSKKCPSFVLSYRSVDLPFLDQPHETQISIGCLLPDSVLSTFLNFPFHRFDSIPDPKPWVWGWTWKFTTPNIVWMRLSCIGKRHELPKWSDLCAAAQSLQNGVSLVPNWFQDEDHRFIHRVRRLSFIVEIYRLPSAAVSSKNSANIASSVLATRWTSPYGKSECQNARSERLSRNWRDRAAIQSHIANSTV